MRSEKPRPTTRELFESWAIDSMEGGDGGDSGSPYSPAIWVISIEHGDAVNIAQEEEVPRDAREYSIEKQLIYPYNRQAFKLLAVIHGAIIDRYERFAKLHQPWVRGSKGYFKGYLYPYPCNAHSDWSDQAVAETGYERKEDCLKWCDEYRLPVTSPCQ